MGSSPTRGTNEKQPQKNNGVVFLFFTSKLYVIIKNARGNPSIDFIMPSQSSNQNSEVKDIINKIEVTLRIRAITLASFLLAVSVFWWLNFFSYSNYIWLTIVSIALWLVSAFVLRALINKGKTVSGISNLYFLYSAIFELGLLTIIVFTNGGIMWIGAIFYLFTIIYSNIVLSKIKGYLISLIAFLWFGGLVCLQYFKIIPFLPYAEASEILYLNFNYIITTLSFLLLAFVLSGLSANVLTDLLRKRTADLEKLRLQLEETKVVLEIRVRARTRELEEIANTLDEQVKERTQELQEKITDLKRFQSLAVNRELKMIKLKKEMKIIKDTKINSSA